MLFDKPIDITWPLVKGTPEDVEKSLQKVREQEGDKAHKTLQRAMQYILYYDLSLAGNKEKLYKKLDGKTSRQIIAMMKR